VKKVKKLLHLELALNAKILQYLQRIRENVLNNNARRKRLSYLMVLVKSVSGIRLQIVRKENANKYGAKEQKL